MQEAERQHLKRELEAMKSKVNRRSLSLIIFFGELFKLEMLKESLMHKCISKLLSSSFECFCKLMPTCGKQLDTEEAKVSTEDNILAVFILGHFSQHLENLFLKSLVYLQFSICLPASLATDGPVLWPHKLHHQKGRGLSSGQIPASGFGGTPGGEYYSL